MKIAAMILCCVVILFGGLYSCTHRITYTTTYPRKAQIVEKAYVSAEGNALIQTSEGYIVVPMLPQFELLPFGPNGATDRSKVSLPHWNQMRPGTPPAELLHDFEEIPLFRLTSENLASHPNSETLRKMPAAIVFENEDFVYGQQFAWLSFRLYSTDSKYRKFNAMIFSIELPSHLEWHISPKPTKFMSVGG